MNPEKIRDQFLKLDVPSREKYMEMMSEMSINKKANNLKFLIVGILYFYTNYKYFNKRKGYKPFKALLTVIVINTIISFLLYQLSFKTQIKSMYFIFKYWLIIAAIIVAIYYFFVHKQPEKRSV